MILLVDGIRLEASVGTNTITKPFKVRSYSMDVDTEVTIEWADGWSPEKVQEILDTNFWRVGFKAASIRVRASDIWPGMTMKRFWTKRGVSPLEAVVVECTSYAVHLAWKPYHFSQSSRDKVLALAIMKDNYPGASGSGSASKTCGTEYTIVAVATTEFSMWWKLMSRGEGLALFGVKNVVGSRIRNRSWKP
jgi:hypothetical protein